MLFLFRMTWPSQATLSSKLSFINIVMDDDNELLNIEIE